MHERATILMIDDDPGHLKIYGWIIEAAGYRAQLVEVRLGTFDLPDEPADMVLLDYNLTGKTTAVEVAKSLRSNMPDAPVVVLSDVWGLPDDIAPYVAGFVRKGEPAKLVAMLHSMLQPS